MENEDLRVRTAASENPREISAIPPQVGEPLRRVNEALELKAHELTQALVIARAALEATTDGIIVMDPAGTIVEFNGKFLHLWGLERALLESGHQQDVLQAISTRFADPAAFLARIEDINTSGLTETLDVLHLADGRVFERLTKTQQAAGRDAARVWSVRDITEKMRAQESLNEQGRILVNSAERSNALRKSELQFQQLMAGIHDCAIYMLDCNGYVASWNPGAERIKGYKAEEILGQHVSTFYTEHDRANGLPARALKIAAAEGKYETEAWRVRKDGKRFWGNILIDAMRGADGQLIGFAKITRDLTERRAMEEQLHQSQKMETIGHLTGGVAHDFNNLLTVILGNLETVWRQIPPNNQRLRRAVDHAIRGAQRAATLTQQLLAFSRRQPLDPKPTDINQLVSSLTDLIRRTLSENISVQTILAGGLWRVEVDPHQLESALLNLAVNSRDAMPTGGNLIIRTSNVEVEEDRTADLAAGQFVLIDFSDTGEGMTEEVLAHAFDPFFTTKPIGKGTGLGLSQVFGFVKQSGGHVELQSAIGQGTSVRIYLPRLFAQTPQEATEPVFDSPKGHCSETILVVEDDDDVRIYSVETMKDLGYSVLEAQDAASALAALDQHPEVTLVFSDVGLPGMNGRELVDEVLRRKPGLKVLFTSGYARDAIVHQGRLDAGIELLTKPFTRAQLATRLRDILDARDEQDGAQKQALIVDDEPLVRVLLGEILADLGFVAVQAASAGEALENTQRLHALEIAFIDIGLPDRSGLDLAAEFRLRWPNVKVVVVSGYGAQARGRLRTDPSVAFLGKPFNVPAVQRVLDCLGLTGYPNAGGAPPSP